MEHIYANRRRNIERVIAERFGGNVSALARGLGVTHNQVWRVLGRNGKAERNPTEVLMRGWEAKLNLPEGYFDMRLMPVEEVLLAVPVNGEVGVFPSPAVVAVIAAQD